MKRKRTHAKDPTHTIQDQEFRTLVSNLISIVEYETNTLSMLDDGDRCARAESAKRAADTAAHALAAIALGQVGK